MLRGLFHRSEPEHERDSSGFRFAYLDWHMSGILSVYKMNTPTPLDRKPEAASRNSDQRQTEQILKEMHEQGWQTYIHSPNQEGWTRHMMQMPPVEHGYELCVLTWEPYFGSDGTPQPPISRHLYRLGAGKKNENMLSYEAWSEGFDAIVRNLAKDRWEATSEEKFPLWNSNDSRSMILRLYRRRA